MQLPCFSQIVAKYLPNREQTSRGSGNEKKGGNAQGRTDVASSSENFYSVVLSRGSIVEKPLIVVCHVDRHSASPVDAIVRRLQIFTVRRARATMQIQKKMQKNYISKLDPGSDLYLYIFIFKFRVSQIQIQ